MPAVDHVRRGRGERGPDRGPRKPPGVYAGTCARCGAAFTSHSPHSRYCQNRECRNALQREQYARRRSGEVFRSVDWNTALENLAQWRRDGGGKDPRRHRCSCGAPATARVGDGNWWLCEECERRWVRTRKSA